jgi:2-haloacid dehalogenase
LALQRFSIKAEETVFIDDNPNNVAAANALGIMGILFEGKEKLEEVLMGLLRKKYTVFNAVKS